MEDLIQNSQGKLTNLLQQIEKGQFKKAREWGGADVIITTTPLQPSQSEQNFYPDPATSNIIVITRHAQCLSWLFCQLGSILGWSYDSLTKYAFFSSLAIAALRYQYEHLHLDVKESLTNQEQEILSKILANPEEIAAYQSQPVIISHFGVQIPALMAGDGTQPQGILLAVVHEAEKWLTQINQATEY
ncbi:hypothetical protein C7H19_14230 [Aphanothece hegewaldii CCALA 016]|uniref:Uncharacterized protein n=1 Tax=Aphanothece hegewaldii CCALA 016 TaxID=2107694 RepID=A0A2T1LW67_9CHRO|nr:hypothetical protein [Aphanothece hegewaldii]PSF36152.1 hypothetical protein C7H19_14230 [Aphanothece hegewaldii CCALA 016]